MNEIQTRAFITARAFRVVHTLILTDKNAVFRLALYPPLRPSAVRVCMYDVRYVCIRICVPVYVT